MYRLYSMRRAALAVVLALGMVSGITLAADFCHQCPPAPPACSVCQDNASLAPLARTGLPGFYSNDYDYSVTARYPIGMNYYIPTEQGVIEDSVIPLRNPVDRYYATHKVVNGRVVDESAAYQAALAIPHYVNPDGTQGALATASETYGPNEQAPVIVAHNN